jgi:protein polybromo-1
MKAHSKKIQAILDAKLKQLYDAIRDFKEPKNQRQVATIFLKLPSKLVCRNSIKLLKLCD